MATEESPDQPPGVIGPEALNVLGTTLRNARQAKGIKQAVLARALHVTGPSISNLENGQRLPSTGQLTHLAAELDLDVKELLLLRTWQEVAASNVEEWSGQAAAARDDLLDSLQSCVNYTRQASAPQRLKHQGRTLADFPEAFENIVVVTGDRRDLKPKNAGDVGAYSASPIDDRWIHRLGLPRQTEKVSDKEFMVSSRERLQREYGDKTLLVLGSPASNHLARSVNSASIFRFNLRSDFKDNIDEALPDLRAITDTQALVQWKRDNLDSLKKWINAFFTGGIVDPLEGDVRGYALRADLDYATITFAANPFYGGDDFRYVAIMVAGFHHPGTARALAVLAKSNEENIDFSGHPYGGVLEVRINQGLPWEDRMRHSRASWDTVPYTKDELIDGLAKLKTRKYKLMDIDSDMVDVATALVNAL